MVGGWRIQTMKLTVQNFRDITKQSSNNYRYVQCCFSSTYVITIMIKSLFYTCRISAACSQRHANPWSRSAISLLQSTSTYACIKMASVLPFDLLLFMQKSRLLFATPIFSTVKYQVVSIHRLFCTRLMNTLADLS